MGHLRIQMFTKCFMYKSMKFYDTCIKLSFGEDDSLDFEVRDECWIFMQCGGSHSYVNTCRSFQNYRKSADVMKFV